jgi:hypothetical protein
MDKTTGAQIAHSIDARRGATKAREVPFALEQFTKLPPESYVDVKVVAGLIGGGISTVWARLKRNDPLIPKPRKFGRSTRFNVGQLRAALAVGESK